MTGRRVGASLALVTLLVLMDPHPVRGQATGAPPGADVDSWATAGIWGVFVEGGSFGYDGSSQLPGLEGGGTAGLGVLFHPGAPFPHHAVGFDFRAWWSQGSYPSLVPGAAEAITDLSTRAFALGGRVGLPPAWPVGLWLQGGLAYVEHIMRVEGLPAWFLPGIDQRWEEDDAGWSPYWGVSAEARIRSVGIGLEKRWLTANRSFDDPFGLEDVDLDGSAVLLTVTWYLGREVRSNPP
jgi:hypothetical protein